MSPDVEYADYHHIAEGRACVKCPITDGRLAALVDALRESAEELDNIIDQKGHTGLTRDIRDRAYAALATVEEDDE